jgi:bifunctional non-homologous end joining protein LigD
MPKPIFPDFVAPMMAETSKAPFDSPDWIFEIKPDGYRAITVFDATGKPHLWSRNGLPLEAKFPAVANAVSKLKLRATVLDGEVVAVDESGIPRFQLLQRFQKQPTAPTLYYVFDVLWYKGEDLTEKTILERRSILERALKPAAGIQLGSYVEEEGKALFELTKDKGMEGIIAKRKDSFYRPGKRTSDWLKIKARLQQEFVVGGFTAPKGSRKHLGAVVLGAYTKGKNSSSQLLQSKPSQSEPSEVPKIFANKLLPSRFYFLLISIEHNGAITEIRAPQDSPLGMNTGRRVEAWRSGHCTDLDRQDRTDHVPDKPSLWMHYL